MNAGRRVLENIAKGTVIYGLSGLLFFNFLGCGKKINNATNLSLPFEKLDIKTYSEITGPYMAEKANLDVKVEEGALKIDYNILIGPKYVWAEIDTGGMDVSSMDYLYLKMKGGEPCPSKVKIEIGSKSEDEERRLGVYIIGFKEKISSNKWTGVEIPMTQFKEKDVYSDPNLVYSGLSDQDLKNLGALFFVFSDTFNNSEKRGTLFVRDIVFSKKKLKGYIGKE